MSTNKIFIPYYISNNTGAPAQVLPRVFFYNGLKESDPYWIQHWTTSSFGKTITAEQYSSFPYFDNYSGQETTTSSLSLLFLNEDPVYGAEIPSQSLYDLYWAKYVDLLYNPRTRIIRLSAVLPFPVYQKLELNDIIQLRSNYYHLRAINDYNLKTGECRMELLGPLLEGSLNNQFTFDNTCEQAPTLYGSVLFNTSSQVVTFGITGSNCCNNPNYVTIKIDYTSGSCPATPTNTVYETVPNSYPINVDLFAALAGSPGVNCVTMSVANLCYGIPVTGSYALVFTGSVSGSYGNTAISASTQKNNCPTCQTGSFYTTFIAANTFSSSISQSIAQASASAYLTSVSQSNANTFGSCSINTFYNIQISASVTRDNCPTCQTGSTILYTIPASSSMFTNTCSLSEANTSASIYFAATSQSYANTNGTCIINYYYNTATSSLVQRNNCGPCATGSFVTYSLAASQSQFTSTCSFAEAQSNFIAYYNSTSQSYANTNGTCSFVTYYSTAISASVYKNDCTGSFSTGSFTTVTLAASYSMNTCSVADANISAQAYFNANSQSWANASGSCSPTASYYANLSVGSPDDVVNTWNFPLTYSVISTGSIPEGQIIGPPSNDDPRWLPFGYRSGSQNTGSAGTGVYYPMPVPTYFGSNCWVKVRDKFGNRVRYHLSIGSGSNQDFMFRVNTQNGSTLAENSSLPHLNWGLSQSLGTGSEAYFETSQRYYIPWPGLPVTTSYIYTTSSVFPTLNDSRWTPYSYYVSNSNNNVDWRAPNVKIAGETLSIYDPRAFTGNFISSSGYYYFKMQCPNNFVVTNSLEAYKYGNGISSSYLYSGSMLQVQVFLTTQSDDNTAYIQVY